MQYHQLTHITARTFSVESKDNSKADLKEKLNKKADKIEKKSEKEEVKQ